MGNGKKARGVPWLGAMAFSLASIVNPAFFTGCSSITGAKFDFGEAEMVTLLNETGKGAFRGANGKVEVVFDLKQTAGKDEVSDSGVAAVRPAHACGSRTFLRSADACIDDTQVKVEGVVTIREIASVDQPGKVLADKVPVTGTLIAYGTTLNRVNLNVGSADKKVAVSLTSDGKTFVLERAAVDDKTL